MKDRIILLIKAKNLTAAQFADEVGVQKSSISHIISGRNNASLDFVQKILLRYPEVNMNWILFGKGSIFKEVESTHSTFENKPLKENIVADLPAVDLFSSLSTDKDPDFRKEIALTENPIEESRFRNDPSVILNDSRENTPVDPEIQSGTTALHVETDRPVTGSQNRRSIIKIVEFYSDNTYKEFFPA